MPVGKGAGSEATAVIHAFDEHSVSESLLRSLRDAVTRTRPNGVMGVAAPSDGLEGRESETSSGSTLRGVSEKACTSCGRCWLQPLLHKGVGLDTRVVGHVWRKTANATALIYLDRKGELPRQLGGLDQSAVARDN